MFFGLNANSSNVANLNDGIADYSYGEIKEDANLIGVPIGYQARETVKSVSNRSVANVASQAKAAAVNVASSNYSGAYPADAAPGQCFSRITSPAKYETYTEKVLLSEASSRVSTRPAKYKTGTKRVLASEASTRLVTVPATYKTVTERVEVRPASSKLVKVPAKYGTASERILVEPARKVWKEGAQSAGARANGGNGDIMCMVEIPAKYKTVTKKVLRQPASVREVPVPAQFKTVTRKVVATPASVKEIPVPATYKTITVTELVEPATQSTVEIPAKYGSVTKKRMVAPPSNAYKQVVCKSNASGNLVRTIQKKLGLSPDGQLGPATFRAVDSFQRRKGLHRSALSEFITYETLQSLGIQPSSFGMI